jgi:hypothetical protein
MQQGRAVEYGVAFVIPPFLAALAWAAEGLGAYFTIEALYEGAERYFGSPEGKGADAYKDGSAVANWSTRVAAKAALVYAKANLPLLTGGRRAEMEAALSAASRIIGDPRETFDRVTAAAVQVRYLSEHPRKEPWHGEPVAPFAGTTVSPELVAAGRELGLPSTTDPGEAFDFTATPGLVTAWGPGTVAIVVGSLLVVGVLVYRRSTSKKAHA